MAEETHVRQNREVDVNWLRINVPSIAAIVGAAVTITIYINNLEARLDVIEQSRQQRSAISDKNFDAIQQQLAPLANLPYRVGATETGLNSVNQRVDQLVQLLSTKIDSLSDRVNGLSTKVEVLAQKIDGITPQKKADMLLTTPTELVQR